MAKTRIATIALVVPDYAAGLDFYVTRLGWTCLSDIDLGDGKRWVTVAPPGADCALLLARAVTDDQRAAIGNQTGGRVGFFLETDDFEDSHARMLAAGVEFLEQPRHESYGSVAVWRDPFGNTWDLIGRR
ncbi:MAG: VOC family protein [Roseicyclus sp.]